jgi:hypothetical protein
MVFKTTALNRSAIPPWQPFYMLPGDVRRVPGIGICREHLVVPMGNTGSGTLRWLLHAPIEEVGDEGVDDEAVGELDDAVPFVVEQLVFDGSAAVARAGALTICNVRGSTGYGKSYTRLDEVHKREDSVNDLEAAVDWLSPTSVQHQRIRTLSGNGKRFQSFLDSSDHVVRVQFGDSFTAQSLQLL